MPKWILYSLLIISLAGYIISGYFIQRSNFSLLISVYSTLFLIYFFILKYHNLYNFNILLICGLLFRFILIFSIPALSDDFYRFVWDGRIQQLGFNPFDFTPRQLLEQHADPFLQQIFPYLNSPDYYSVYPQLCQTIFKIASAIGTDNLRENIIILKILILLAEIGSIYLLKKLVVLKNLKPSLPLFYILNPLVIIELSGNIHFEAFMIFFFLLAAWLIYKQSYISSAGALSLAIQAKLLPLIAIPLLVKEIGIKKTIGYCIICMFITIFLSFGLLNTPERFFHFFQSLGLYYGKFEFNGGLYLLLRSIGWWIMGYNPIATLSKIMIMLSLSGIIYVYFKKFGLLKGFFWVLLIYLVCASIVHPWYLTPIIALSIFVKYRFVLVWSALIPLSYLTYSNSSFSENYWVTGLEYLVVLSFFIWELRSVKSLKKLSYSS